MADTPSPPLRAALSAAEGRESSPAVGLPRLAPVENAGPTTSAALRERGVADAFAVLDQLPGADATFLFEAYSELVAKLVGDGDYMLVRSILETTPHPQVRTMLIAAFADVWARNQPAAAAAWIASLPAWPDFARVMGDIASTWAARDPEAAAIGALSLPSGEGRRAALENLVMQWRVSDLAGVSEWLSACDLHPDFDPAIAALATDIRLVGIAPLQAMGWAESMVGESARLDAVNRVAQIWAESDSTAARNHLETTPYLTTAQRAQLLTQLVLPTVAGDQ